MFVCVLWVPSLWLVLGWFVFRLFDCVNSVVVICFLYCCDSLWLLVIVSMVCRLFWLLPVI